MKVEYRKRFLKELSKIPPETRQKIEKFVFEELPKANSIYDVGIMEQMKGYLQIFSLIHKKTGSAPEIGKFQFQGLTPSLCHVNRARSSLGSKTFRVEPAKSFVFLVTTESTPAI